MSLPEHDPRHTADATLNAARINAYTIYRRACGIRPSTLRGQATVLQRVASKVGNLDTITADELVTWLASHLDWAPETRKFAQASIRGYFKWAHEVAQVRPDNPTIRLGAIRVPPPCPRPVPEDALAAALAMADDQTRLMLLLAAHAGLRLNEIATLHTENLSGDLLYITGKGGRTRVVPVGGELLARLRTQPPGWVFPGRFPGTHCTGSHVHCCITAVLPPGYTTHKLRHRYASQIYGRTHDVLTLQELLGHASPNTTRRYVRTSDDDLRRAAAAAW